MYCEPHAECVPTYESNHLCGAIACIKAAHFGARLTKYGVVSSNLQGHHTLVSIKGAHDSLEHYQNSGSVMQCDS
jgi:hypothetical protein